MALTDPIGLCFHGSARRRTSPIRAVPVHDEVGDMPTNLPTHHSSRERSSAEDNCRRLAQSQRVSPCHGTIRQRVVVVIGGGEKLWSLVEIPSPHHPVSEAHR
ncbi:hypothetical protein GW17_00016848 [Ensete ventricosum]|nr:hypothetical protein GW17_00016848 [Ensete ventricosum]RZS13681.1 hypothetical protein BHM03_00045295 [Ensete ventricosum]